MTFHRSGRAWFCLVILICAGFSLAQEPDPATPPPDTGGDVVFRTETSLMEVEVKAKTKRGDLVEGLTRDDFQLFENGEPQQIVSFEYVDYPRIETPTQRVERVSQAESPVIADPVESVPKQSESNELRIFIATHISEVEELRARKAVLRFIERDMPEHAQVSINGTPFISNRAQLLAYVEKVGLRDILSGNNFTETRPQIVMDYDSQVAVNPTTAGAGPNLDALVRGVSPSTPSPSHNMYDDHLSRFRMLRYVDLIRDLSIYPGKKMIVLFSRGYSMGFDSFQRRFSGLQDADLLERLRGESMRARISMYVVDARGLEVGSMSADNATGMTRPIIFSQTQANLGVPGFVQGQSPITSGLDDGYRNSQQGLKVLAKMTDGVALTDSNDLGKIFDHVKKDLGGYYLIGYSPPKREDTRRMREVKITVNRPEIRLDYRKGFYDNEEFRRALAEEQRKRIEKLLGPSPSKTTDDAPLPSLTLYKTAFEQLAGDAPSYPRVIEDLEKAVEGYPQFAVAWNVLGYSHEQLGNVAGAREAYEKSAGADPEYLQPQAHLARMEIQAEDWEAAKKRAEVLLKADQKRADARFYLATAEFNLDNLDAAGKALEPLTVSDGAEQFPEAFQLLGIVRARNGDFTAATEAYQRYLDIRPNAADREFIEEQIETWRTAQDIAKLNETAQAGDWEMVVELGEQLTEVDIDSGIGPYFTAMAHSRLGNDAGAKHSAAIVLERADRDRFPDIHRMLGTLHAREGNFAEASRSYREFIAKVPDVPDRAKIEPQLNDWEKQLQYQKREGPVIRVINPTGRTTVTVVRGPVAMITDSPDRSLKQGDVVVIQESNRTTVECRAADARVDLEIKLPYGFGIEAVSESGDIIVKGMTISANLETKTGGINVTSPWKAMRLAAHLNREPPSLTLPPEGLLETSSSAQGSGLTIADTHHEHSNTYGRVEIRAETPKWVVFEDMQVPPDSVVKMPWQAPAILEGILSGEPTEERPANAPSLRAAAGLAPDAVRFSSEVHMVSLSVSVKDENGAPVQDLNESSFEVIEDGVPQKLVTATSGDAPFNLAVLLDMSASTIQDRAAMKTVARRFVAAARPEDNIAVYTLGNELFTVDSLLTSNRDELAQRLELLPPMSGGSPLYDAIVLAYNEELHKKRGQRNALLIISDGVDNQLASLLYAPSPERKKKKKGKRWVEYERRAAEARQSLLAAASAVEFDDLHRAAGQIDTLIYPFLVSHGSRDGRFQQPLQDAARARMEELAAAAGGRVFYATTTNEANPFQEVTEELRSVYTLAYYPKNQTFEGQWRDVEVRVDRPGVVVRTRDGYTAR